jgi:hypothetical protein
MPPPGQGFPLVAARHDVTALEPLLSMPQHTCPLGQSHAWTHPKLMGPEHPLDFGEQLQVPTITPPEMPVGVKQQSLVRRSHAVVPHVRAT